MHLLKIHAHLMSKIPSSVNEVQNETRQLKEVQSVQL